jgi:type IV secretion system protein VirD4
MKNFYYNLSLFQSRLSSHFATEKSLGNERFALPHEVAHLSCENPHDYGIILGVDQFGRTLQITPTKNRPNLGNVLKVAPSQGGKSTDFKKQLRHFKGSVIANDIKEELSRDTAEIRAEFSDVYFVNPLGNGNKFDPLFGKTIEDDLYDVANMLLYEPNEKDPAFTQRAIKMLTILLMAARVAEVSPFIFVREVAKYGVNTLAKCIHEIDEELGARLVDGDYDPKKDYRENRFLVDSWDSLTSRLYPFLTETVAKSFSGSDFRIADILLSKRPVTIYLTWPESKLRALQPIIKLIWGTFISELKDLYDDTVKKNSQSFFQKILFLIDEGGVTPIPELYDHVTTVNGRGMSFVMGIQSLSQFDAVYGKDNAETILNNCAKVIFRQESFSTAKIVSEWLGGKSAFASSQTKHGEQTSEGKQEREIPLMTPQEIRGMPEDELLIWVRGVRYPIKAKRVPKFEKEFIAPSPPPPLLLPAPQQRPKEDTWRRASEAYPVFFAEQTPQL